MKNKINSEMPKETCDDRNCPFHGTLRIRGKVLTGIVTSAKMHKSVTIEWERKQRLPKYERYEVKISRIRAHNPPCINAKEGDEVKVAECRPLSKTKNFVVVEKIGRVKGYTERVALLEESKFKERKKKEEEAEKESAENEGQSG